MRSKILTLTIALLAFCLAVASGIRVTFSDSIELCVLMYHHIAEVGDSVVTVSTENFDEQLAFLSDNGYTAIGMDELAAYASGELELPKKCVAIVFDDGYRSNYELAYPILQKYNMKATISLIGIFVGSDTYKDTGVPILPYLDWDMAREMYASGLIRFASHTYDMHMSPDFEEEPLRLAAVNFPNESAEDFVLALTEDHNKICELFERELGYIPETIAYPNGQFTPLTEATMRSLGAKVTLTTKLGRNRVFFGRPESAYLIRRYSINDKTTLEMLKRYLSDLVF